MNQDPPPVPQSPLSFFAQVLRRLSVMGKVVGVGIIGLLLLIPLGFVSSLQNERASRQFQASRAITSTWGESQQIIGPVLIVPYRYFVTEKKAEIVKGKFVERTVSLPTDSLAYFLPHKLNITGNITPHQLHKGIYQAVVYDADLNITGEFLPPDFAPFKISKYEVRWDQATLAFPIADLRGVSGTLKVTWGTKELTLLPGTTLPLFPNGVHVDLPKLTPNGPIPFTLNLSLRGSGNIHFAPVGMENVTQLKSTWPDPNFGGAFLPKNRTITPKGFEAAWHASYYSRSYPQQWLKDDSSFSADTIRKSLYGVELVSAVDSYRTVERSIKYGVLFIALVFVTFFLFEILSSIRIHAFQYLLVGAALVLFYLTLLSLSEFIAFAIAYSAAAFASTLLITLYSAKILKSRRLTLALGAGLAIVYGLLYFILQLQDYALLAGSAGLLIALGAVMYATRNINWYQQQEA